MSALSWIGWYGGPCPVRSFQSGTVRHRNGLQAPHIDLSSCEWAHSGDGDDIVAYQLGDVIVESNEHIDDSVAPELYSALIMARDFISGITGNPNILGPIDRALKKALLED